MLINSWRLSLTSPLLIFKRRVKKLILMTLTATRTRPGGTLPLIRHSPSQPTNNTVTNHIRVLRKPSVIFKVTTIFLLLTKETMKTP